MLGQRGRIALLLLVPMIGAGIAFVSTLNSDDEYRARATVLVPTPSGGDSVAALAAAVNNYRSALESTFVIDEVSAELRVSPSRLRNGLGSTQLEGSRIVEVTYTGSSSAEEVTEVVGRVSRSALRLLIEPEVETAELEVGRAQFELAEALEDLDEFVADSDNLFPSEEFRITVNEIASLRVALANARANGDASAVESLEGSVIEAETRLRDLSTTAASYDRIALQRDRALANLVSAQERENAARALQEASESEAMTQVAAATLVDQYPQRLRQVLGGGVIGAALAVLAVTALQLAGARRTRERPDGTDAPVDDWPSEPGGNGLRHDPAGDAGVHQSKV